MSVWRPINPTTYLLTWVFLVVLAALSFGLSYVRLGGFEVPLAMAIAVAKALLVLMFFMHLFEHRFVYGFAFLIAVVFILILVSFTAFDVITRPHIPIVPPLTH